MENKKSPANPRVVVYLDSEKMKIAERKAAAAGHKNAHRWAAFVILKALRN